MGLYQVIYIFIVMGISKRNINFMMLIIDLILWEE